jgi:DNA segregation ATPase FtsK/SpoIIIE, S-DNA-T family
MSRPKKKVVDKKNKGAVDLDLEIPRLKDETKHGILAVLLFALAIFFGLAWFESAGLAGKYTYDALHKLFGLGYLLIPVSLIVLSASFLKSIKPNFFLHRLIGGALFFLAGLSITSLTVGTESGGIIGQAISTPLLNLFDIYSSLVFLVAIMVISLSVIFDAKLTLGFGLLKNILFKEKEVAPEGEDQDDIKAVNKFVDDLESKKEPEEDKNTPKKPAEKTDTSEGILGGFISGFTKKGAGTFTPPPLSLLEKDSGKPGAGDIKANANIIKRTLANFGINVEMDEISIGPSVTRYALKPAEGVKLSRIVNLQNDLSLALAAHPLRIEAPIPGKSLVGIEIPNTVKTTVGLGTLLATKEYADSPHPLLVALGRGISGIASFGNVAKSPHLLIAGTTGSGKSVTIHTLIMSLLYRNPPERLRFIMIDPKRVELTLYNKISHLLTPVITDPKKAISALRWAAKEMDRRYNILESHSVRDIQSYHQNIAHVKKSEDEEVEQMPYIVIIIDELADIMSSYPRELEAAIVRLAQMSRAVGIHLVLSTQRPSVEVITGLIKANIPSRIALQVASQIDSRTIIDMPGAEKLLGAGDMLYLSGEMAKPIRVQSAFISETEVKNVVKYLIDQYMDAVPDEISLGGEETGNALFSTALDSDGGDEDDLYETARESVIEAGKASASYLQRKLKVGYARAARLLDMLEERGVIGPGEGAKPREVFGARGSSEENNDMM